MRRSAWMRGLALCAPFILAGCATIGPPQPPSLDLPQPPLDLRASRKGDRVTLTWTLPTVTTDRQTIQELGATRICRGFGELKGCGIPVGQTLPQRVPPVNRGQPKPEGFYVDIIPATLLSDSSAALIAYAVEVPNKEGRAADLSNRVKVSLVHTLPQPKEFQAQLTSQGVQLHWSGAPLPKPATGIHYVYRVYRSGVDDSGRTLVGEVPVGVEQSYSLTDTNFEWEKTYIYRAETVSVIESANKPAVLVEGDDTPEVRVFADDIFPPAVPIGLQAVFSGPGQKPFIDLIWAPVSDADLAGYNVYRLEDGGDAVKLNPDLIRTSAYRDTTVQNGKHYMYSVSAVDQRGNESGRSEEAGEAVP